MTNSAAIRIILEQYRFTSNIDVHVRSSMIKSRKSILIGILKKSGKYSLLIMISLHLVYFLKKAGIQISVAKGAAIIVTTAASVAIATVTVTGILHVNKMRESRKVEPSGTNAPVKKSQIATEVKAAQRQKVVDAIHYRLQIASFKCSDDEKKIAVMFETIMRDKMRNINGEAGAVFLEDSKDYVAPNILAGSIFRSGDDITISVRLVDSGTSKVKLMITEKIRSDAELPSVTDRIAKSISHEL